MNINKKTCLVTGASSGIGYAIAKSLHAENYSIVATARRNDRLKQLNIEDILAGDLCNYDFQDSILNYIISKYGKCDYLFNCAGTIEAGSIEEIDIDKMTSMLRLNIEATFRLIYKFIKLFKEQEYGHMINISSVLGTKVRATAGAYSATKFAIEALSEALRMELTGTNIKITCIEPGLVMTELHNDWPVHPKESMNIKEPLNVENIVEIVKFILKQPEHVRIPKLMILPKDHNI
jgi:NADP-dependent 3-hydroxy acid dehydrogenase YdfG